MARAPSHTLAYATACSVEAPQIGSAGTSCNRRLAQHRIHFASLMSVLQPFAALYVLILASAWPLLAKESERIYGLFARLFSRLRKKKPEEDVEEAEV